VSAKRKPTAPAKSPRGLYLVAGGLALIAVIVAFNFPRRAPRRDSEPSRPEPAAGSFQLPPESATHAEYGGSASCQKCHEEAYELWAKSHHGLAERSPDPALDEPAFNPARRFTHATQESSVGGSNGSYHVTAVGLSRKPETLAVDRIIGHSPLRQMLVPSPGGRWQTAEATWDPHTNEWFNVYGTEDRQPGEWGHWSGRGMNWNTMCATCHNTRLRKNYDTTNDVFRTAMVERGVGCESCHGPMKAHNDWQYANEGKGLPDPTIKKLSREQMFDTCAACHSRRGEITGDPRPGESYFDHHLLSVVDESNLFYPDGQIWDEDYEVTAFLGSKMYHQGVRCMDCHDFHSAKVRLPGNMMCLACHGPGATNAPVIDPVSHSRHKVFGYDPSGVLTNDNLMIYRPKEIKETGGECVNCHMPQTPYMQRHWRHDHGFTIPDPLLTKQHGIPNACNRCHADKSVDWALESVEKWYGDKMNRPYRHRAQTLARAKAGDDSARPDLLKMLASDEIAYWRAAAANFLEGWAFEPAVGNALVRQIQDTNALVRQEVIRALPPLERGTDDATIAALRERLSDPVRNVRVLAAQALGARAPVDSLAVAELRHMLEHNADQPAGQLQLGAFHLARSDATNALPHYETAVRWDPFAPAFRHELGVVLSQMGRAPEALAQMQEAVQLAPRDAEMRFKLALAWNEVGDLKRAQAELEQATQLDPRHARAWYNLGLARNAAGNTFGAIEALRAAETASPQDARIPYARATIHARMGQPEDARRAARRALEINPEYREANVLLQQLSGS
jgi:Flp pilus assembly protein TadD